MAKTGQQYQQQFEQAIKEGLPTAPLKDMSLGEEFAYYGSLGFAGPSVEYNLPIGVQQQYEQAKQAAAQGDKLAEQVVKGIEQQYEASLKRVAAEQRAGRVAQQQAIESGALARTQLAQPRGFGSGAAFAGAGQIAAQTARARRDIEVATAERVGAAEMEAAKQLEAKGVKLKELADARAANEKAVGDALADAQSMFNNAIKETILFFTSDDRRRVANEIRRTYAGEQNHAVIAALEDFIRNTVLNPNNDASGVIG